MCQQGSLSAWKKQLTTLICCCLFALAFQHCGRKKPATEKPPAEAVISEQGPSDAAINEGQPPELRPDAARPELPQGDSGDPEPDEGGFNCQERGVPGVGSLPTKIDPKIKGKQMLNFVYKGEHRPYLLHLPTGYDHQSERPLVFVFHAGNWQADKYYADKSDLPAKADATNTIMVFPQGVGLSWYGGNCCAKAFVCQIDDVGFVRALVAELQKQLKIDATHIHAMGHSNGGSFTHRLATQAPDIFASVATGASTIGGKHDQNSPVTTVPDANAPIPIVMYHGKADRNVSYGGGLTDGGYVGREDLPFETTVKFWLTQNQCPGTSTETKDGKAEIRTFTGCKGADVIAIPINGLGHAWPDPANLDGFNHVDTIFKFFNDHPRSL